jgi:DNA-binding XRE family transcriptional regulator
MTQGVATRMRPKDARSMLRVSQLNLAKKAKLSPVTIIECEKGKEIRLSTAYAILDALNAFRTEKDQQPLEFKDIEWNIWGEEHYLR